jgi:DNA-directed RNA polymerase sigma subunit (sigma70/sigma32)
MEMPEEKIRKILKISKEPISMETPIGDDDDSHLGDFIEDASTLSPSDAALYASLREVTKEILALSSRCRGNCAGARNAKDGGACAAPSPRSGGCVRA